MAHFIRLLKDTIFVQVKVVPGASKSEIAGIQGDALRIRIAAAPEDGKANAELISFLSKLLGCPKKEINLVSGEKSRIKTLSMSLQYKELLEKFTEEK
jgi:uncharacterized protein (TIGR00251 family)